MTYFNIFYYIKSFSTPSRNTPIVYLDESGFMHDMPRTHGYFIKGERCFGKQDWGAKGRTNAIGALLDNVLLTVSLFGHNIDSQIFSQWIKEDLIPKLPNYSVIVLDNAAFHKNKEMQDYIKILGIFLSIYQRIVQILTPLSISGLTVNLFGENINVILTNFLEIIVHNRFISSSYIIYETMIL